jgi:hypothetical protein
VLWCHEGVFDGLAREREREGKGGGGEWEDKAGDDGNLNCRLENLLCVGEEWVAELRGS